MARWAAVRSLDAMIHTRGGDGSRGRVRRSAARRRTMSMIDSGTQTTVVEVTKEHHHTMPYVIQRPNGGYRTPPGSAALYSSDLRHAQIWTIKAVAVNECTADEHLVPVVCPPPTPSERPRPPLTAEHIRWMRSMLCESTREFGRRFRVSKRTVEDWEQGRRSPNKWVSAPILHTYRRLEQGRLQ